ncbi:DnaJ (Hsp40) related, subfamily B, member 13, isoform CRA_a [Mus musculus]|nr:DnaJ (Hsp40) related, subfamily B, member 13, isoform CRA_a [Mus musculus]
MTGCSTSLSTTLSTLSTSRLCQVRGCHCLRTPARRETSSSSLTSSSPPASHPRRSRCCARHC